MIKLSSILYRTIVAIPYFATIALFSGCATYYQKIITFNQNFEEHKYSEAKEYLEKNTKLANKKNTAVLYDLNLATVAHLTGDYNQSIELFNKADKYYQDYTTNWGLEAVALLSNPNVTPYKLENFEPVMIHFYQALNYIAINEYEEALVECRRMNEVLNALSDNFKKLNNAKHYSQDAFGHYLMGLIYEATGDHNNAFIAYRNAYNIYNTDYSPMYGTVAPKNLKQAIIRSAKMTGFTSEAADYEREFNMTISKPSPQDGRVVLFVLDNLAPIKDQIDITFNNVGFGNGIINFTSDYQDLHIAIPYIPTKNANGGYNDGIQNIKVVHIAIPKYNTRFPDCQKAAPYMLIDKEFSPISIAEDIDQIARQSLHDRILLEVGKSILRAATKMVANNQIAKQNDVLGAIFQIGSAIAERADTRHWQSLPGRIMVVDRYLSPGTHSFEFQSCGKTSHIDVDVEAGKTSFAVMASF
ncbi:MAG: hypothetical protein Q4C30_04225 [Bacteroidia bacterium]|nr:hypothetical protein [Bacteroidia bacterium]